jgi:lipoprotein-releasing system permease protein
MSYELYIARRFLSSRHRTGFISFITFIAMLGVAIGTAVLIIALAVITGFERKLEETLVGFSSHIQIQGFQNQPLGDYAGTLRTILAHDGVVSAVPFVQREGMIRSREGFEGVLLKGIDSESGQAAGLIGDYLREGSFDLTDVEPNRGGIIIGAKLARQLKADIGDRVTVFALEQSEGTVIGFARAAQFIVMGLYETGMAEYDDIYVFVSLSAAQRMLRMGDSVSGYDVMVGSTNQIREISESLFVSLGYPHYPRTMYQMYRHLFTWIELQKKPIPLILGLIILVASVNSIGTMLMLVMEKTAQIGTVRALGATKASIGRIFVYNGMIVGAAGVAAGNLLGFILSFLQYYFQLISIPGEIYYMNYVPVALVPAHYIAVSAIALLLCFICTLVPARLAGRLDPIKTIRFA